MERGTVVTFYSYKGGVGRTFAMANVATLMAMWGFKVLCIDWDLEAPGLSHYFEGRVKPGYKPGGLVDVIKSFRDATDKSDETWARYVRHVQIGDGDEDGAAGSLDYLPAGETSAAYFDDLQSIDWAHLYQTRDLGRFLERLRSRWVSLYDFVIIDSRTGVSDTGGICAVQLPDILAVVFTANEQSVQGTCRVLDRIAKSRERLPFDRSSLHVLPIASRFDAREEYEEAQKWQARFIESFANVVRSWSHKTSDPADIVRLMTIPYYARWSFGEELAVVLEEESGTDPISHYFEVIASALAQRLDRMDLLTSNRDAYVDTARRLARRKGRFKYDVFISFQSADLAHGIKLKEALESYAITSYLMDQRSDIGSQYVRRTMSILGQCRHLVMLLGDRLGPFQEIEYMTFVRQTIDEKSDRLVLPVLLGEAGVRRLPPLLARTQPLRLRNDEYAIVASQIEKLVVKFG